MSYIYKFIDRTITEYTIKADSEKAALDTIDSMWWKKQMTMQENIYSKKVSVFQKAWIDFETPTHVCDVFISGDDEDKKYCEECWSYVEND